MVAESIDWAEKQRSINALRSIEANAGMPILEEEVKNSYSSMYADVILGLNRPVLNPFVFWVTTESNEPILCGYDWSAYDLIKDLFDNDPLFRKFAISKNPDFMNWIVQFINLPEEISDYHSAMAFGKRMIEQSVIIYPFSYDRRLFKNLLVQGLVG